MKRLLLIVGMLAVFAWPQSSPTPTVPVFAPPQILQGPPIPTATSQCTTPAAHQASSCPVENPAGTIVWYDWDGKQWNPRGGSGVKTVNGKSPDSSGNVQISAASVTNSTTSTTLQ